MDFTSLSENNVNSITVSGIRSLDMLIRLKYVDIKAEIENNVEEAIKEAVNQGVNNLYVLVNYTALQETHLILNKMEKEKK